jgi:hypothetical protein
MAAGEGRVGAGITPFVAIVREYQPFASLARGGNGELDDNPE